jgi:hypothetical protein
MVLFYSSVGDKVVSSYGSLFIAYSNMLYSPFLAVYASI